MIYVELYTLFVALVVALESNQNYCFFAAGTSKMRFRSELAYGLTVNFSYLLKYRGHRVEAKVDETFLVTLWNQTVFESIWNTNLVSLVLESHDADGNRLFLSLTRNKFGTIRCGSLASNIILGKCRERIGFLFVLVGPENLVNVRTHCWHPTGLRLIGWGLYIPMLWWLE